MTTFPRRAARLALACIPALLALPARGLAEPVCLAADGEAAVVRGDVPAARLEAVARAKWSAVEQAVGVEVKSRTVVQNMALVDEAIFTRARGVISSHRILEEDVTADAVRVKVDACVEPAAAEDALSTLAMNSSIAVLIPARQPRVASETEMRRATPRGTRTATALRVREEREETNVLSETVIGKLADRGYTVVDVVPTGAADAAAAESAIRTGDFTALRSLTCRFLSGLLLVGKVDYTVSTPKGQDVGYGLNMPFNNVTARMTYRLVTRGDGGSMVILAAGTEEARAMAPSVEDATAKAQKALAEKFAPPFIDKVSKHIRGNARKCRVSVEGVPDLKANFQVKSDLGAIAWVAAVDEAAMGEFDVTYPENAVYLANGLAQKGYRIVGFSPALIRARSPR